jgi:4-hydroxybenzoate polyprenyltransferase
MGAYLRLLRPPQWIKNVFVFAGVAFGNKLLGPDGVLWDSVLVAWLAFIAFCAASSVTYILNDIVDREQDRLHPTKSKRPLASGEVTVPAAIGLAVTLLAAMGLVLVFGLGDRPVCGGIIVGYLALNLFYSFAAKRVIILDVITIAVGFVLRAYAGAEAVDVFVSPWLIVCTFTLCLFLGFGKRRCELAVIGDDSDAAKHRPTLAEYTPEVLTTGLNISAGLAIVTFLLYTVDPLPPAPFDKAKLMYTLPLVVYGIFRYLMLIGSGRITGPTDVIIRDRPFLLTVLIWVLVAQMIVLNTKPPPTDAGLDARPVVVDPSAAR